MASRDTSLMGLPPECRSKIIDEVLADSKPHIEVRLIDESWDLPEDEWEEAQNDTELQVEVTAQNIPHPLLLVSQLLYQETKPKIKISATYQRTVNYGEEDFIWDHVTQETRELIDELTIVGYSAAIPEIPDVNLDHVTIEGRDDVLFFILPGDKLQLNFGNIASYKLVSKNMLGKVESGELDEEIAKQMASLLESHLHLYLRDEEHPYSIALVLKLKMWLTTSDVWTCFVTLDYDARKILERTEGTTMHLENAEGSGGYHHD